MFSDLYKVTQTPPTASAPRAQEGDTREEIRRHDPDQDRKKGQNKKFAQEQSLFGDDQTEISVESLETFLPMLLRNYSAKETFSKRTAVTSDRPQSSMSAKAAGAYARMAQYSPVTELQQKVQDVQDDTAAKNPTLSRDEVQAIHRLQADVAQLRQKGIKSIYIDKAGSLLESLQNAVSTALQG